MTESYFVDAKLCKLMAYADDLALVLAKLCGRIAANDGEGDHKEESWFFKTQNRLSTRGAIRK